MENFFTFITFANSLALTLLGFNMKLTYPEGNYALLLLAALINFSIFIFFVVKKLREQNV